MKKAVLAMLCVFIVLFAVANQCDKSASSSPTSVSNPTTENSKPPMMPTKGGADNESVTAETNICDVCGNRFTGRGYTEITHGEWRETEKPYQSFICSRTCGMQHTRNWEEKLKKLNTKTLPTQPTGYTRQDEENEMYDPCGLCGGTGFESNRYGDERICPMCDGTGKRKN